MRKNEIDVLIMIRSQMLRAIIRDALKKDGFTKVSSYDTGATGLRQAKAIWPGLIIVDFGLSDMTGMDVLKEVRKNDKLKDAAFIMISSEPEMRRVALAAEHRVNAFVVKPFSQQTLTEKVNFVLERQINPAEGVRFYREANGLAESGNYGEALEKYKEALGATNYSMAAVFYKIGKALEKIDHRDDAEISYGKAIERSGAYIDALDAMSDIKIDKNEPNEAVRYLSRGVKISPLNASRQMKYGEALYETEDYINAEKAYLKSMELEPVEKAHIYNRLAITSRRLGKLPESQEYFIKALELSEDEENLHYNLGQVYMDRGMKDDALKHLKKALHLKPDFKNAEELIKKIIQEKGES